MVDYGSSGRNLRRKTAGYISQLKSGDWAGRRFAPVSRQTRTGSSSMVAAILGEATFDRLCRSGVRLFGHRYEVDAFEEAGGQTLSADGEAGGCLYCQEGDQSVFCFLFFVFLLFLVWRVWRGGGRGALLGPIISGWGGLSLYLARHTLAAASGSGMNKM